MFDALIQEITLLLSLFDTWYALVLCINLLLIIFSKKILARFYHHPVDASRFKLGVTIFRVCNLLVIIAFAYYHYSDNVHIQGVAFKSIAVSMVIYISYAVSHFLQYYIRLRYGKSKDIDGKPQYYETYNSRLLSIFASIFVFIVAFVSIIQIVEFESLLQAGGAIGVIGVFFALTQAAWAPDLFSGLIILNSGMVEVGDVIEFNEGDKSLGVVYKTKVFHTEILNLINNHRIMIKNAKLRENIIHNLSKFASAKGLRECLKFKISYTDNVDKVKQMFNAAYKNAESNKACNIEFQYPLEIGLNDTGDYALEWFVYYYTKDVRNIIRIRQQFREIIHITSQQHNISLATPSQHVVTYESGTEQLNQSN